MGGSSIGCHGFNVILINRFRIFLVGLDDGRVSDCGTNGRDDVGFKNVCAICCKGAADWGFMISIGGAGVEGIRRECSQEKEE